MKVVVLGAGITGLVAAYRLFPHAQVTVLERERRVGGKVLTGALDGVPVEAGPDGLLARIPEVRALCGELGLGGEVVEQAVTGVHVWTDAGLRRLPQGLFLGVPSRLGSVAAAGVLSPAGLARAALDLVLPATPPEGDEPVAEVVARRLGAEVVERLVDPLLGGVYAGDTWRLSTRSVMPELERVARTSRSLLLGLRRRPPAPGGPFLLSLRGGLGSLTERLAERLGDRVRTGLAATAVRRVGSGWRVVTTKGDLEADAVVLTVPAPVAADLLAEAAPAAARPLGGIRYAAVATVALAFPGRLQLPEGSGFLAGPATGRLIVGATFLDRKWPHLERPGRTLLRVAVGRDGDERWRALGERALVSAVCRELQVALGQPLPRPQWVRVTAWEAGLPQYEVGHQARLQQIDAGLAAAPGVLLAGAGYRGVGLASCILQAEDAARRVLALA